MQYYEDVEIGLANQSPQTHTFTTDEIKNFASEWDPMPFHLDEDFAKHTPAGKLFASGIHTIAAGIKLNHTMMQDDIAAIAGLGWTDIKFPVPVFAGDTIYAKSSVIEKRESKSKPDRGIIISLNQLFNQHDVLVVEYKIATLVWKKPKE